MKEYTERQRAYKRANAERRRQYRRDWRARNKEREGVKSLAAARAKKYPPPTRPEPTHCEVCGGRGKRRLHLDHDHLLNRFRGWLCGRCNFVLGLTQDNPVTLRALATYLERSWKK